MHLDRKGRVSVVAALCVLAGAAVPELTEAPGTDGDGPPEISATGSDEWDYRLVAAPDDLRERFGSGRLPLLEKLNRADLEHLPHLDTLVVPRRWDRSELDHSPLPREVPEAASEEKVLVVHQPLQVFGAYERGTLTRWGPVSSGRLGHATPPGLFHLTWRDRGRYSTVDPDVFMEWYFNFEHRRGLAFHAGPLPGQPASLGCVRLLARDARWLYWWGEGWVLDEDGHVEERGTPVRVMGTYDFDARPPWLDPHRPHPPGKVTIPPAGSGPSRPGGVGCPTMSGGLREPGH